MIESLLPRVEHVGGMTSICHIPRPQRELSLWPLWVFKSYYFPVTLTRQT